MIRLDLNRVAGTGTGKKTPGGAGTPHGTDVQVQLSIRKFESVARTFSEIFECAAAHTAAPCASGLKASCPHRFAKLHEDCTRSIPPLRRERRFALHSSLMGSFFAFNREPAHIRIRTSHTRMPCSSLSLPVQTMRAFGQLLPPRSHISALIPAFSFMVISVGWLLHRHGWPSVGHRCRRRKPTRNR